MVAEQTLSPTGKALSAPQLSAARVIEGEFRAAGYGDIMIAAAIVNAMAESSLNPLAAGDGGQSIGLFQLYSKGAGAGMTVEQRQDPATNTRRIIEEVKRYGKKLRAAYQAGEPVSVLANWFCQEVERPANKEQKGAERAAMALKMYPGGQAAQVDAPPGTPPTSLSPQTASKGKGGAAIVFAGFAAWLIGRRKG